MRPTRETVEGRVYLDLQNQARRDKRPTDELLTLYALEGFLTRLAASPQANLLVRKGGVLLAAFEARRPTRDVDLHAHHVNSDVESVLVLVRSIAAIDVEDGLVFSPNEARAEVIRDAEQYSGVRVTVACSLARADVTFHVDVNVGDPITPAPQSVAIPKRLGGEVHVLGYPLAMVHAEKLVTAVGRGVANTRWRDFGDIYILSRRHDVDGTELATALATVATHREVELRPLAIVLAGYADLAQPRYQAWRRKNRRDELPSDSMTCSPRSSRSRTLQSVGEWRSSPGGRPTSPGPDRTNRSDRPARVGSSVGSAWVSRGLNRGHRRMVKVLRGQERTC